MLGVFHYFPVNRKLRTSKNMEKNAIQPFGFTESRPAESRITRTNSGCDYQHNAMRLVDCLCTLAGNSWCAGEAYTFFRRVGDFACSDTKALDAL